MKDETLAPRSVDTFASLDEASRSASILCLAHHHAGSSAVAAAMMPELFVALAVLPIIVVLIVTLALLYLAFSPVLLCGHLARRHFRMAGIDDPEACLRVLAGRPREGDRDQIDKFASLALALVTKGE